MIENIIIIAIVAVIVTAVIIYLVRAKKNGQHCISCPDCKKCNGKCHCDTSEKK